MNEKPRYRWDAGLQCYLSVKRRSSIDPYIIYLDGSVEYDRGNRQ